MDFKKLVGNNYINNFIKNKNIFSFCLSFNSYFYVEGSNLLIGGHLSLIKKKINFFSFIFIIFFVNSNYFCFFFFPFSFYYKYFSAFFFSENEKYIIYDQLLGSSFGFFKKFKFESRLYGVRVVSVFSKWQLAICPKVFFTFPVSISIKKVKKKTGKRWWTIRGVSKSIVFKEAFLYKSFRFPDLYSKIGVFLLNDPYEWRNTLKRIR